MPASAMPRTSQRSLKHYSSHPWIALLARTDVTRSHRAGCQAACEQSGQHALVFSPRMHGDSLPLFFAMYGRALHVGSGPEVPGGALSDDVDWGAVERSYLQREHLGCTTCRT